MLSFLQDAARAAPAAIFRIVVLVSVACCACSVAVPRGLASDSGDAVTDEAAAEWKKELAERSRWWSLQPPQIVKPPAVSNSLWQREAVDRFIFSKISAADLSPAPVATAEVLLRRLAFVLTGLPPEPERVAAFRSAFAANPDTALEGLVDQLLASPQFGERFARHWMDVVRYTDTYGYEWDIPAKGSWEYRDYLIRAFNNDIGYDQLIREQIAGDLLDPPRINEEEAVNESLIGPMFYHFGEHRHGSSLEFNGIHQEMIDNKVDAFSKTFLAMTVACARCHDHKLDAISQADYYALAGVFMTPRWTARCIDAPGKNDVAIETLKELRSEIRRELAGVWRSSIEKVDGEFLLAWARENRSVLSGLPIDDPGYPLGRLITEVAWLETKITEAKALAPTTTLLIENDGATVRAGGVAPGKDHYSIRFTSGPGKVDRIRLEALTHADLPMKGPGRTAAAGNFVLRDFRVELRSAGNRARLEDIAITSAEADYSQRNYPIESAIDSTKGGGWAIGSAGNVNRTAIFYLAEPVDLSQAGEWTVTMDFPYGSAHTLGRFRISVGSEAESVPGQRDEAFIASWERLVAEWQSAQADRSKANEKFTVLTDFSEAGLPADWSLEGDGLKHGFVDTGTLRIALDGDGLIADVLPRGYHTHALSPKLPAAIRLPEPDRFSKSRVSLLLAGGEWAGHRAIPQNAFLQEGPKFFDPGAKAEWQAVEPVAGKHGVTRVLTEIATAALNPNFPARTGVAKMGKTMLPYEDEGFDKPSWFSITGAVAHDTAGAPLGNLDVFVDLFDDVESHPQTRAQAWQQVGDWITAAVVRWADGEPRPGDTEILDWLLAARILPNDSASAPGIAGLVKKYRRVEAGIDFPRSVNSMDEAGVQPINYRLNERGDVYSHGAAIPRGFLEVFAGKHNIGSGPGSGRLELAGYLSSAENPQTARVYVNRVWQWIFGVGIVTTPNDFGKLGGRPSHPELLDWLAIRFIEEGWSTKKLVRRLVLSQTFRQSGEVSSMASEQDPDNRLWHHYPTRRLEAEAIRDSLLAVSGRLDPTLYGRPINPPRSSESTTKRLFSGPLDSHGRRSIYMEMSIMQPPEFLVGFNLPDLKLPTGRRDVTNVPAQALIMLNDPLVREMAEHWGSALAADSATSPPEKVGGIFLSAFGREPDADELLRWSEEAKRTPWAEIIHTIFNAKEFIYYR